MLADFAGISVWAPNVDHMAVVADPARLEAQHDHREAAIADTYTMIVRQTINTLAVSAPREAA